MLRGKSVPGCTVHVNPCIANICVIGLSLPLGPYPLTVLQSFQVAILRHALVSAICWIYKYIIKTCKYCLFICLFIYLFAQIQLHRWSKHVIVINVQCTHSNLWPFQMIKLSWFFILHVHGSRPSGMILNMSKWCVLTKTEILTTKCMQNSVTEEKGSLLLMLS